MPKTFRNKSHIRRRHTKKSKQVSCKFQATTQALIKWYVSLYEKLGWMVLAKEKGLKFKLEYYKKSIHLLKDELVCKINSVQDYDKINDLRIILDNVIILERHVQKDFR
jgi:hypothetical protein